MRASGVNAAIARYREAAKKLRAIGITRIGVARIMGFYYTTINHFINHYRSATFKYTVFECCL